MKFHIIVAGSAPSKTGNKYDPMPEQNIEFINQTLKRLDASNYAALYHGMAKGVDLVVDDYAFRNGIRVRQFPAYWFDPTKEKNYDARAGYFSQETMIRSALDAVYNKEDEQVLMLAFYNTANLAEDNYLNHVVKFASDGSAKRPKIQVHAYQLPVLKSAQAQIPVNTTTQAIHPF